MMVGKTLKRIPEAEKFLDSIAGINAELERAVLPLLMTEKTVEGFWMRALQLKGDSPGYWLLLVRLAEAALLCAGNYADNCEYEATGDLLVNPLEITVQSLSDGRSTIKNRHGRLSEQFGLAGVDRYRSLKRFFTGVELEVTKPPLLAHMTRVLKDSGRVSRSYIHRQEVCQRRIADALAFLAAWGIFDSAELWRRLEASPARERAFAESCLCRFDTRIFGRIGLDLRRSLAQPHYRSPFLIRWGESGLKRTSPASPPELAASLP